MSDISAFSASAFSASQTTALPLTSLRERGSLLDFQEQLSQKLQNAKTGTAHVTNCLGFQTGDLQWLVKLTEASEIATLNELYEAPLTQPWFLGLTNIRGNLYTVIDLSKFAGGEATPVTSESRLLIFADHLGVNCAILISQVSGLLDTNNLQMNVSLLRHDWIEQSYQDSNQYLWLGLNLATLIKDSNFLSISL